MPERTCVGCRRRSAPDGLVRLRLGTDRLELGPGPGRGAWICGPDCLARAARSGALTRALRRSVPGPWVSEVRSRL
ncbi:MAG: YlxR family protein [Microthrixaceae bacterium]